MRGSHEGSDGGWRLNVSGLNSRLMFEVGPKNTHAHHDKIGWYALFIERQVNLWNDKSTDALLTVAGSEFISQLRSPCLPRHNFDTVRPQ